MSRKKSSRKTVSGNARPAGAGFDPDGFRYYFPVLALILLIAVVILFSDFIFSDQMMYGSDMINAGIFFRHFYVEYFQVHGTVPVWNPYIFGGMPFIDAFHGDIFYPLSVLKFIGNFYRNLGLTLVLHIFMAGLFMYFTARQFRLSRVAATMAAVAYGFSGFLISLVTPGHDGKIFVTTLFPLTILFLDRAFEKKPILNFTLLGLVIGIIILSPHPQLSYYALWALAFYGIFKLVLRFRETRSLTAVVKPGALLAAAVAVGLMISAVQFYPGYIYTTEYSPRADTKQGYDWATSWSMHEEEAFSQIVPEFSGTDAGEGSHYWGKNAFKDNSEYVGIVALFMAMIGLFFYRRKEGIFFGGLALFALIYALGDTTPLFRLFYYIIPKVKSLRAPSTIMFLFLFSISLLAGMGMHYLIERGRQLPAVTARRLKIYLLVVPGVLLLGAFLFAAAGESMLSLYTSIFYGAAKTTAVGQGVTKWNLALMNLPGITGGLWTVFLLTALAAGAVWLYLSRKAGLVILLLLPLLGVVDGIRFNSRFVNTYDGSRDFNDNQLTQYLSSKPGKFRVFNARVLSQNNLPFHGIEVVTGYHGNQLRWYDDLLGGPNVRNLGNPRFLNLVGAEYILAPTGRFPSDYFGPEALSTELNFGQVSLYKNANALPRAFLADRYEVIPERQEIYPRVLEGTEDLERLVYLEEEPPLAITPDSGLMPAARIESYANDSVLIDINADHNALLVVTDNYYYAWEAFVDGVKTDVLRADGSFRAIPVAAGAGKVLLKYNRARNNGARLISLLTLLGVAVILLFCLVKYLVYDKKEAATI